MCTTNVWDMRHQLFVATNAPFQDNVIHRSWYREKQNMGHHSFYLNDS